MSLLVSNLHYNICLLNSNTLPNIRFGFLIKITLSSSYFSFCYLGDGKNPYLKKKSLKPLCKILIFQDRSHPKLLIGYYLLCREKF